MRHLFRRTGALLLGFLVVGALVAGSAWAQVDTGTITVRVQDPDGAALPGVSVTLTGPQTNQTKVTGADGSTRFPALRPGSYNATFELQGFQSLVREGLQVSAQSNVVVNATLELATVEETITVTGESPVVDVKSTKVGSVYDSELIDRAPTASGLWAGVLDHVPGVVTDEFDVGGGESGQQAVFSSRGSGWDQNTYSINGANTEDPSALGASSMYYSTASFDEVQVSTGAHDIEFQKPGVVLNIVTKQGTNDFHGGAKVFFENESFVSQNVDQELIDLGVDPENENATGLERLRDYDVQAGGPIFKDRAWFFVDYWKFEVDQNRVGLPQGVFDDTELEDWTLRGTVQVNDDFKVTGTYLTNKKLRTHRSFAGFVNVPPESMWVQDSFVDIPQIQGQYVVSEDGFLDVRFSKMDMEFPLTRRPDAPSGDPILELTTGNWTGPPIQEILFMRDRSQVNATYSHYVTGEDSSHDLKFGASHARNQLFQPSTVPNGLWRADLGGSPFFVWLFNSADFEFTGDTAAPFDVEEPNAEMAQIREFSAFAQDTWTFKDRLTITAGVRWDQSTGRLPQQNRAVSNFPQFGDAFDGAYQQASFPEQDKLTDWSEIRPRVGVVYDILGDGRWALKGNFAQYTSAQATGNPNFVNQNAFGDTLWIWSDTNGNNLFDFGEQQVFLGADFPGATTAIAEDFTSPITTEFTLGLDHELFEDFLVSVTGIVRSAKNLPDTINTGVPFNFADGTGEPNYTPVQAQDPGPDGVLGTADDGGFFTLWNQDPSTFGDDFIVLFNPDQRGLRLEQDYRGLELTFHKRWSDNWQVLGSWTIQKAEMTSNGIGDATFDAGGLYEDPNNLIHADGETFWSRTHVFKLTANYLIAEPIGVNLGLFFRHLSGTPFQRFVNSATAGVALNQGNISFPANRRGDLRRPSVDIFDFRAEKQFTLPGRYGTLHAYFDWFNLTNENTLVSAETTSGPDFGNVTNFISPRVFRFGAAWNF